MAAIKKSILQASEDNRKYAFGYVELLLIRKIFL